MAYVAQNGGRIIRALLEIAISRKWADASATLMAMSKAVEKRMWPFEHPLAQLDKALQTELLYNLRRWADDFSVAELAAMEASDLGELIHMNERHGAAVLKAAKQFPTVHMTYELRPLSSDLLRVTVHVKRDFEWSPRPQNSVEPYWLWVEDHEGVDILQLSNLVFRHTTVVMDVDFIITFPGRDSLPSVTIRYVSDRWLGAENEIQIPLADLVMPVASESMTRLLPLPFLSLDSLDNEALKGVFSSKLHNFNAIQTQSFWSMLNTNQHALLCAPAGSGKSTLGHMLLL